MREPSFNNQEAFPPPYTLIKLPELTEKSVSAEHFLHLGNQHYQNYLSTSHKKELDLAIHHYEEAIALNPSIPETHLRLGTALLDKGSIPLETAIDYCEKSLQLNPKFNEALVYKGSFLLRSGDYEQAIEILEQASHLQARKKSPKLQFTLVQALLTKAKDKQNRLSLWGKTQLTSKTMLSFTQGCLYALSDIQSGKQILNAITLDCQILSILMVGRSLKLLNCQKTAQSLYHWSSKVFPEESIFYHLLGDFQVHASNLEDAIFLYEKASEAEPNNPLINKKLSQCYERNHNVERAIQHLEQAVECGKADFETLYALAKLLSEEGDYIRSLYYFKELVTMSPKHPYVHGHIAFILFKLNDYEGAILEYQKAIEYGHDPVWVSTIAQTLGTLYYQIKEDPGSAIQMYEFAVKLNSEDIDCLCMLGDLYMECNQFDKAIGIYQQVVQYQPDNADCFNLLGFLLWQIDDNDEAIKAYNKAILLKADNAIAYNNLGVIYLDEQCIPGKAQDMFQQALTINPQYTLACFNLGRSLEAVGSIANAAKLYAKAQELNISFPELSDEEIEDRLLNLFSA